MNTEQKNSVLIVDDGHLVIEALTQILGNEYTIYAVKDGQDAIETAEKFLPDVILLDIIMPEMDGHAVITALKNSEATRYIPVIFISGLNEAGDEEKGLMLGAADYIFKPFAPEIVRLRVKNQIKLINQMRLIIEKELSEKSSRAKISFLSNMSHEMLTPMNVIMGMTQIAKQFKEPEKTAYYLNKIENSGQKLLGLINDLLELSGNSTDMFTPVNSVFSVNTMCRKILEKIKPETEKKQQSLTYKIDQAIPILLIGEEKRLAQVITNLLTNAVKFTPENGSIHFSVSVVDSLDGAVILKTEITDSGIGVSKELQDKIFNIFEQADDSLTRSYSGAGLGLAISKHIIEMLEGDIWVESEPGKGSKFVFTCKMRER